MAEIYDRPGDLASPALVPERCVIWGNGPNVLEALDFPHQRCLNIGTNKAAVLPVSFQYYCISDIRFLDVPEKRAVAESAPGRRIYASFLRSRLPTGFKAEYLKVIGRCGITDDLAGGVYHGFSVVWFALQVALWLGCKDIFLAGCPHDYTEKPRFYDEGQKPSPIDNNTAAILTNYRTALPFLQEFGVRIRTIGKSRLQEAGVTSLWCNGSTRDFDSLSLGSNPGRLTT